MTQPTALFDLLAPYFLAGVQLPDGVHNAISLLHVDEVHSAWDESGVCLWGIARVAGDQSPNHTTPQGSIWDWHDVTLQFRLTAARSGSNTASAAFSVVGGDVKSMADAFGHEPGSGSGATDFPGSRFKLELLLTSVTVHLPFLRGAKLDSTSGLLSDDPAQTDVKITLPKILVAINQGDSIGDSLSFTLESWGAEGLDDPTDLLEAQLIQMDPPYALAGTGHVFGFGFRKAILDLSDDHTPPEILSQFGAGDDWKGVYLPEVRLFVAPSGLTGLAVDASAKDFLIGVNDTPGISGDFELDVVNQNLVSSMVVGVRIYNDRNGKQVNPTETGQDSGTKSHVATAVLPTGSELVVIAIDVQNAMPPYKVTIDGTDVSSTSQTKEITLPHSGPVKIHVEDSNPSTKQIYDMDLSLQLQGANASSVSSNPSVPKPAQFTPGSGWPAGYSIQKSTAETSDTVTLSFNGPGEAMPTVTTSDGQTPTVSGGQAVINVANDSTAPVTVTALWPASVAGSQAVSCYFTLDHPASGNEDPASNTAFVLNPMNTGSVPATGNPPKLDGVFNSSSNFLNFIQNVADGGQVAIQGYASWETTTPASHNNDLSRCRADGLRVIIQHALTAANKTLNFIPAPQAMGDAAAKADHDGDRTGYPVRRPSYWRADANYTATAGSPTTLTATLQRQAPLSTGGLCPDVPPGKRPTPSWFHRISVIVRIAQSNFIALEVKGEVDFKTAAKQGITTAATMAGKPPPGTHDLDGSNLSGNSNPGDGVVDFDLVISHDDSIGQWREQLIVGSGTTDRDGLWRIGSTPAPGDTVTPNFWTDVLGMYAVLAPLLNSAVPTSSNNGNVVELAVDVALPFTLAALGWVHVENWTWYGVELIAEERANGGDASVLLDYETDVWLNVEIAGTKLITCAPDKPVKVRYRAVGFRINWGTDNNNPTYQPMFDASKGYSIDVTDPGTFKVPDPLGKIIQVLGARVARTNPLNIELDMGFKANLGVVSVDRLKVRLPVDPVGAPTITALGVSVDIPNALKGRGYLSMGDPIMGQLDVTIIPVKVRVSAGLAIGHATDGTRVATSVLATLAVEFPTPIILGSSSLGIYGFLGLFAMHFQRLENASALVPALDWFERTGGDPTKISTTTWGTAIDRWAFGVGAVLGTLEGGYVINLKGMIILEIPGPRLLIFMKASLISVKPPTKGTASGTLLAVLDLDFGRGTLTIGISVTYEIKQLLKLKIPITCFFDFHNASNFYIDVGTIPVPITVTVLDIFTATGYLEIHGNGIPDFPLGALSGFSIATGLHVALVWGDKSIGLYLEVAAGFDAGVGFSPLMILGEMTLDGSLHLFIVSIEANGKLDVKSDGNTSHIQGSVCGKVDFFFFSVSGCVSFALGSEPPPPPAPPLVRGLSLQSRSPASVLGTGVDRPIDGALCNATIDGSVPQGANQDGSNFDILVPIDSIPVLHLEAPPRLDGSFTGIGDPLPPAPMLAADGFFSRGKISYAYNLKSIQISPVVTGTAIPSVWRSPHALPDGDETALDLALLDWTPNPTPKAIQRSALLTEQVEGRWGEICSPVAPATAVFWSFQHSALGSSATGWTLAGTAWPDAPGTRRSQPTPLGMSVTEAWRSTNSFLDSYLNVEPAKVIGAVVPCIGGKQPPTNTPPQYNHMNTAVYALASDLQTGLPSPSLVRLFPQLFISEQALVSQLSTTPFTVVPSPDSSYLPPASFLPGKADSVGKGCSSRVLEAPFAQVHLMPVSGTDELLTEISKRVEGMKTFSNGLAKQDLSDALIFDAGPLQSIRLLVLVPVEVLRAQRMILRPLDGSGASLGDKVITGAVVTGLSQIPASWRNAAGPWYHDAMLSLEFFAQLYATRRFEILLIDQVLPSGTLQVELGLKKAALVKLQQQLTAPSFLVGAIEAMTIAEVERVGADQSSRQADITTIDGLIGSDPANRALLIPDTLYTVTVNYQSRSRDDQGNISAWADNSQHFSFKTDAHAPFRLDPWILAVNPGPDEGFHFYEDPINVVFSTDDVLNLFGKYGLSLQGVARAASFRPAAPSTISSIEKLPGTVLDPWEDTLQGVLDTCTCTTPYQAIRHGRATLALPLDSYTDYVFDIVNPELAPTPEQVQVPLFRRAFTTSRYATATELANDVFISNVQSIRIAAGMSAHLNGLPNSPADVEVQQALRDAGMPELAPASKPRVWLIWEDGTPPTPVAILIDACEPLWRYRPEPQKVSTGPNQDDYYWALQPTLWLQPKELVSGTPLAARFVASSGGSRTLVLLNAGARGNTLHLQLTKNLNVLLDVETSFAPCDIFLLQLSSAPWEDLP